MDDDGRVLDPRCGCLVAAATTLLSFFACDYGCDDPSPWASTSVLAADFSA
jgi:hypothetical protein